MPWARRDGAVVKVLALHARDPIWTPVLIPAALLPIQLPACGPGKQWETRKSLLASDRHSIGCCAHLGSESSEGRSSSLSLLSVYLLFQ